MALKCSYEGKYTVTMFGQKKNSKRLVFFFTGKVSLISREIWSEKAKQTKGKHLKEAGNTMRQKTYDFFFSFLKVRNVSYGDKFSKENKNSK